MSDRVVQSLWVGARLSAMGRLSIRSFLDHGHEFHLYSYEPVEAVPAGTVLRDAAEILPRERMFAYGGGFGKGSYSAGSNFFRYKLLLDRGGWWVDTDVVCLQPFQFPADEVVASELADPDVGGIVTASSVIKQPAGSALMQWTWRACRTKDPNRIRWGETGPRLLHEAVHALGCQDDVCAPRVFNPVPSFEWRTLIESGNTLDLGAEVHAVHLWHQMWREHGVDPDGRFPDDCLYEQFRRRFPIH